LPLPTTPRPAISEHNILIGLVPALPAYSQSLKPYLYPIPIQDNVALTSISTIITDWSRTRFIQGFPYLYAFALPSIDRDNADEIARIAAIQSSRVSRDAVVSAEETGGFKYVPGGRE
jgi:hypothetical protein